MPARLLNKRGKGMDNGLGQQAGRDALSVRVLRGGRGGAVRLPAAGTLEAGLDAAQQEKRRRDCQAEFASLAEEVSRMIPLWPDQLLTDTPMQRARLLVRILRAIRRERYLAEIGHWTSCYARASNLTMNFNAMRKAAKQC